MKINITEIMDGVKDFVNAHKKAVIIATGVVVAGAIAVGVGVGVANSDKDKVEGIDTTINEETTVNDDTSSDVAVEDGTTGVEDTTVVDDTTTEETTGEDTTVPEPDTTVTPETEAATKAPETTKVPETTKAPETTKTPETIAPVTEPVYVETAPDTVIGNPSNDRPKYVQDADPNTGISWDGVSPIIYTYADGTTGTEPRDGATYEVVPFVTVVYEAPKPVDTDAPVYDGVHCVECGRVQGFGENGTCLRGVVGSKTYTCPNCGEQFPGKTCHTCDEEE